MDEVKKLLEGFADQAADGLPDADIEADVARGRRALRRIKRRRRVTGVLCVAAVSAAVLAIGNQVKWWGTSAAPRSRAARGSRRRPPRLRPPSTAPPAPAKSGETMSMFGASVVGAGGEQASPGARSTARSRRRAGPPRPRSPPAASYSRSRRCGPRTPPPRCVLQAAPAAQQPDVGPGHRRGRQDVPHRHLDGRLTGQVKLADRWLLVELPNGTVEWTDDVLRAFMDSCAVK